MDLVGGRRHVLEVDEHTTGNKRVEDLAIQRLLAPVVDVMDREARDHHVEHTEIRQWLVEIVLDDGDVAFALEAFAGPFEHRGREVQANPGDPGPRRANQGEQPAVAGADVEHTPGCFGQQLEQQLFAFGAVRDAVGLA